MKISLFDSWKGKFSADIKAHWESLGHEVFFEPTLEQAKTADIQFFYQADNAAIKGTTEWNLPGKIVVQCVDIETWCGQAQGVNWKRVNKAIFMANHIKERVNVLNTEWKIIKPGIDLVKWTQTSQNELREPIRRIAYVVGGRRIWDVKRLDMAFQLLRDLLNSTNLIWQLHIRGSYSSHEQYNAYCKHLEQDLNLKDFVFWYPERIEDLNKWLDDKHYFLLPSTKEAFSYATAETMAKGIKPIINNWQGAKDNWAPFVCDTYGEMLAEMTKGSYEPEEYRKYVEQHYNQERYFKELDEFVFEGGENYG